MVPPAPTPATKWVTRPSVCRQISGPVERSCSAGLAGLEYWSGGTPGVCGQPVGHRAVGVGCPAARPGAHDDLGAYARSSDTFAHLVGHHEDAPARCAAQWRARRRKPDVGSTMGLRASRPSLRRRRSWRRGRSFTLLPGLNSSTLASRSHWRSLHAAPTGPAACCPPGRGASRHVHRHQPLTLSRERA
jgi:hypothetical protein